MTRLSRGRHPTPGHGQCLLELVSTLAGEVWSDRPAAVHPVLASIARAVNDECTDEGRQRLVPFAAELLHTTRAPTVDLVLHCTTVAGVNPVRGKLFAPTVVAHATRVAALKAGDRRDEVLHRLLADCLALCRTPTTNWWTNGTSDDQTASVPRGGRQGDRAPGHPDRGGTPGDPGRRRPADRHDAHTG